MDDISRKRGRSLPHWSRPNGTYFITFRTVDSIPKEKAQALRGEYEADRLQLARELGHPPSHEECRAIRTQRYKRAEKYLEEGHGECLLRDSRAAQIVADAIRFFEGERYELHAWCLMPNHVHVVLTMSGDHLSAKVVGAWKSFSAKAINKALHRQGAFWQEESLDHLIRGSNSFHRFCRYVWDNPKSIPKWPWIGGLGELPSGWEPQQGHPGIKSLSPGCRMGKIEMPEDGTSSLL